MPLGRRHARVEIVRHVFRRQDRDRMRAQMRIQPVADGVGLDRLARDRNARPARAHARRHRCGPRPGSSRARRSASRSRSSISPCTVSASAWNCQPANGVPSYSIRILVARHDVSRRRCRRRSAEPRRNSSAFIGCLPARCNSRMRIAPSPQAMVSLSSSTVPGAPLPSPVSCAAPSRAPGALRPSARTTRRETATIRGCDCAPRSRACANRCGSRSCRSCSRR